MTFPAIELKTRNRTLPQTTQDVLDVIVDETCLLHAPLISFHFSFFAES